jgi:hypothetical protein
MGSIRRNSKSTNRNQKFLQKNMFSTSKVHKTNKITGLKLTLIGEVSRLKGKKIMRITTGADLDQNLGRGEKIC